MGKGVEFMEKNQTFLLLERDATLTSPCKQGWESWKRMSHMMHGVAQQKVSRVRHFFPVY